MKNLIPLFVALVTLTSGLSAKPIICVNGLNDAYVFATTCPPVSNLSVSDVTETTATITWESGGNETQWLYLVMEGDSTSPSVSDDAWVLTTSDTLYLDSLSEGRLRREEVKNRISFYKM